MSLTTHAASFALPLRSLVRRAGGPGDARGEVVVHDAGLEALRKQIAASLRPVSRPSGALFFVSGVPNVAASVAEAVAGAMRGVPALVVPASGVLTETAEVEGQPAVAGIVWSGGSVEVAAAEDPDELGRALAPAGTACLFAAADRFASSDVGVFARHHRQVLGAGAPGGAVLAVEGGRVQSGRLAAMRLGRGPIIESAGACRLVSEPFTITEMDRSLVTRLDGQPALDLLSARAGGGKHGGLVLVAVHEAASEGAARGGAPGEGRFLVRPLRGIDPQKRALAVAAELAVGDVIAFAVRDPETAKTGLGDAARRASGQVFGAAPTFALYLGCAGRGRALYGESDVDVRILKRQLPKVPIAGMHAAFEVLPWGEGEARVQLMSGVLALFRAPS